MNATTATIEAWAQGAAQCGALLLDAEAIGWAYQINERELDLGDCYQCVLGQVFGYFDRGIETLFPDVPGRYSGCSKYGFDIPNEISQRDHKKAYAILATAWLAEIRLRLAPDDDEEPALVGSAAGRDNCPESMP